MSDGTSPIQDYPRGITFEQVWAALLKGDQQMQELREQMKHMKENAVETRDQMKENAVELREQMKEDAAEFREQMKEDAAEFRGQMKENVVELREQLKETRRDLNKTEQLVKATTKQMGGLSNTFGKMVEHLVAPGIVSAFNKQGYHFDAIAHHGMIIKGKDGKTQAEIDLLLENSDSIIAVEVKSNAKTKHIEELIICLKILREHRKDDRRKIHGAIAGAMFDPGVKKESLNSGFYVIEQSGDTMKMNVPPGFLPKAW